MRKFIFFLSILIFSVILLSAQKGNLRADAGYAGTNACKECHKSKYKSYERSEHGKKAVSGSPANKEGCESCHGPGAAHVKEEKEEEEKEKARERNTGKAEIKEKAGHKDEDKDKDEDEDEDDEDEHKEVHKAKEEKEEKEEAYILKFEEEEPAAKRADACLSCHESSRPLAFWDSGKHKKNDVACNECHSIHEGDSHDKEYETCVKCHTDIKVQINKISRHPITEGKVNCTSCHAQHGSTGQSMIKTDSVNELCYTCHAEKRGPYLWEHSPVEENCAICHTPHGSNHAGLLKEKATNLCQSCHDWIRHPSKRYSGETAFTGTAPDNRFFARSCLNCHSTIHGSNAPVNPGSEYNSGRKYVR